MIRLWCMFVSNCVNFYFDEFMIYFKTMLFIIINFEAVLVNSIRILITAEGTVRMYNAEE